jgi:hypothetical protein
VVSTGESGRQANRSTGVNEENSRISTSSRAPLKRFPGCQRLALIAMLEFDTITNLLIQCDQEIKRIMVGLRRDFCGELINARCALR